MDSDYLVLAAYKLLPLTDPEEEAERHREFFNKLRASGRIYISKEGFNIQMSGPRRDVAAYMEWLGRFGKWDFKLQPASENVFPRLTIKCRPLVGLDEWVDLSRGGTHLSPQEWRRKLEEGGALLMDVRNAFEWDVGHFRGAQRPEPTSFRDFPAFAKRVKTQEGTKRPIMMYCTGGIRCEFFSSYMRQEGFEEVYQLEGGVLRYGEEEGGKHWEGKLFVFDDRLAVEVNAEEPSIVGCCHFCQGGTEEFYNCANMDCNALFLCCRSCLEGALGCCSRHCQQGKRVRPLNHQGHKPFRKWYTYFSSGARAGH